MTYLTEEKPQCWRAVAIFEDRSECLVFLGRSYSQVRAGLAQAFFEIFEDEQERAKIKSISLQRWHGAPDAGQWQHQSNLAIPTKAKLAKSA
jgi:hypothetical protein